MNQTKHRVGIIGAGAVTFGSHLPVLVNMPDVSVEWICDRALTAAKSAAKSYRIPKAFTDIGQCSDVDVVLVATPLGSRVEVVPQVLARGWHAFCEKPFAKTIEEHDEYIAQAKRAGVQIGVGQVRRYASPTATARTLLQRQFLGPIQRVSAAEGFRMRATGRGTAWHMTDPAAGGGILTETGSHLIDQVLHILDASDARLREAAHRRHLGLELASCVVADVITTRGESVPCRVELSMIQDLCNGIFIEFPNYVLKVGLFFEDRLSLVSRDGTLLCDLVTSEGVNNATTGFAAEWRGFLDQVNTGTLSVVDAASVRQTTALLQASYTREQDLALSGPSTQAASVR